ncbi:MAG: PASTA domain-containing protein, partial [Anaerolineae bacterium]|nr:PASTA domain-containing protein [Anaerolineae bacterium]
RFLTADHLREALMMFQQGNMMGTASQMPISAVVGSPVQGKSGSAQKRGATPARKSASGSGIDMIMILLGLLAIVAVLGLVPLFVALYNAYQPGVNSSAAGELPAGQVRMPDLVGLEESTARSALENMGLILEVEGEEPHPTWPAFTITEQSILPGAAVAEGSVVNVMLSQGPPLIEVPDARGMRYEEAEQQIQSLDLVVQKYEDWSTETPGVVVLQDPPPNSLVANRTLVTLVVSSGARSPVGANLGGQIALNAYELPRLQYRPGEAVSITFFWQAITPPADNYDLFIRLTTPEGGIVSEIESPPQNGSALTSDWQVGQTIIDPYQLPIPQTTVAGDYEIRVGFFNPATNTRLPITEAGRAEADDLGSLVLRTIQVVR